MSTKLHFLGATVPLTKTFFQNDKGALDKNPYPMVKRFTSHEEEVNTINEFHAAVIEHANQGHCLLKGQLKRPLNNESRAGMTDRNQTTEWMVLDVDGMDISPEALVDFLGIGNTSYFVQYSSSSGVILEKDQGKRPPPMDRYHIFFLLDQAVEPYLIKQKLQQWNLTIPEISKHITLTATNMALKWPLDITVCQNDKLIYIARPICKAGVIDTLTNNRIREIS